VLTAPGQYQKNRIYEFLLQNAISGLAPEVASRELRPSKPAAVSYCSSSVF
jgi:hypothetical protein